MAETGVRLAARSHGDGRAPMELGTRRRNRDITEAGKKMIPQLVIELDGDAAFCHITSICFRIPFATSAAIYSQPATWETGFTAYVGYRGDDAIATAATLRAADVVGLYSVATLPEHQGRGIGEKLTRHALDQAGGGRTVLQSTRQGNSLYRRLGFREVTRVIVYVVQ